MAKRRWADWHGHTWFSLEHDGLGAGLADGTDAVTAEADATTWASRALGYHQQVNVKPMATTHTPAPWAWKARARLAQAVSIPSSGRGASITETLSTALRQRADLDVTLDMVLVSLSHVDLRCTEWQTMNTPGPLASQVWRVGMLADRAYTTVAAPTPSPASASSDIITTSLQRQTEARAFFVQPNRGERAKAGVRRATQAPTLPHALPAIPHTPERVPYATPTTLAVAPSPAATLPTTPTAAPPPALATPPTVAPPPTIAPTTPAAPAHMWANLAGDARKSGATGGLPQCTLAAARNAARNGELTAAQFAQWCEGGDIQVPHWCAFLTDCCARPGEVAVPIDIDAARLYSPTSPRLLVLQTNTGRHAVTFFVESPGNARRFDNDDQARLQDTFTWVAWDTIIHEWSTSASNAMYGLVQAGSPLTTTDRARAAMEREHRRRRTRAL